LAEPLSSDAKANEGCRKAPKSDAGLERNQVPLSAKITCLFRPKSGAGAPIFAPMAIHIRQYIDDRSLQSP
jgi:hypothetical protein